MSGGWAAEKECLQELERIAVLALGCSQQREIGAEGRCARCGAVAETDFTEDDREPEALLGMIVGRFHAIDVQKAEDAVGIACGIDESLAELFGVRPSQRGTANSMEPPL